MMNWVSVGSVLLSTVAPQPGLWKSIDAGSERLPPVYYGPWPREMALGLRPEREAAIDSELRPMFERNAPGLAGELARYEPARAWDVEAWPVVDWYGRRGWTVARYRANDKAEWRFLSSRKAYKTELYLPDTLDPENPAHGKKLFADFLEYGNLYQKPVFGDCVWTDAAGLRVAGAWLSPEKKKKVSGVICRNMGQPPRMDDRPFTLVLRVSAQGTVSWPKGIKFLPKRRPPPAPPRVSARVPIPAGFREAYEKDVRILAGEEIAVFPKSGKRMRFTRKNNADPQNQLNALADYLEERYAVLGIRTMRQRFMWRGIPQSNLIAVLPGTDRGKENRPVLLGDHIDTAFAEDAFRKTGKRVSVPGADDNVSAVAALLRAAEVLKGLPRKDDIWLTHLTGEEFPADSMGARKLVSSLLTRGQDLGGVVQLDMIAFSRDRENLFQISSGESRESQELASLAFAYSRAVAPKLKPVIRDRFDPKSYLYNTDGVIFSDAGYPVILLNERLNAEEHIGRRHYHETTDTADRLDFDFAIGITKAALETVQGWANR